MTVHILQQATDMTTLDKMDNLNHVNVTFDCVMDIRIVLFLFLSLSVEWLRICWYVVEFNEPFHFSVRDYDY